MTAFEINAGDNGLVANNPAAAANNAQVIANCFNLAPRVYLPDGQTYYTQDFAVPTSAKKLFGAAKLIPAGTISQAALVNISGTVGFVSEDTSILVPTSMTSLAAVGISGGAIGTELRRLMLSGEFGVLGGQATDTLVDHCVVTGYSNRGFYFTGSTKVRIRDSECSGGIASAAHCYSCDPGTTEVYISRCRAVSSPVFGFALNGVVYFEIEGCTSNDSMFEGINVTDSVYGQIIRNRLTFPQGKSVDFGMSFASVGGQCVDISIVGNVVDYPGKCCLAFAGNVGNVRRIVATGNVLNSPWSKANVGGQTDPSGLYAAVVMYGPGASDIEVMNNEIRDLASNMRTKVGEQNVGGWPSNNRLGPNRSATSPFPNVTDNVVGPNSLGYT